MNGMNRIEAIDSIRGFALFGILYAHVLIWYSGSALPKEVYEQYTDTWSTVSFAVFGTFVLGKFFTIFSFLFGYSFYLQLQQFIKRNENYVLRFSLRFVFLFAVGFVHHIFWRGDILMIYGLVAFILLLAIPLSDRALLFVGIVLILNLPQLAAYLQLEQHNVVLPMESEALSHLSLLKHGSFAQWISNNLQILTVKMFFQLESGRLLKTAGFMLLGLYAARNRWFTMEGTIDLKKLFRYTKKFLLGLLLLALMLFVFEIISYDTVKRTFHSDLPLPFLYEIWNITCSFFYILFIYNISTNGRSKLLALLAYPGRLAMTTYLSQSVIGLMLFYPFGFALFEKTSPALNALLVFPIFAIQIVFSRWWLKRFEMGPIEMLLKRFTCLNFEFLNKYASIFLRWRL
jgi:uncharacterized protein